MHSGLYPLIPFLYLAHPCFPFPLVTTGLFSICVNLFLFYYIVVFLIFYIPCVGGIIQCLSFSDLFHVAFLWQHIIHISIYTYICIFTYTHLLYSLLMSIVDGLLHCLHILDIVNNAADHSSTQIKAVFFESVS